MILFYIQVIVELLVKLHFEISDLSLGNLRLLESIHFLKKKKKKNK